MPCINGTERMHQSGGNVSKQWFNSQKWASEWMVIPIGIMNHVKRILQWNTDFVSGSDNET